MAKVSYDSRADDAAGLPENTTQFGYEFVGNKPVEVTDPAHLRKFVGHPHFKVSGEVPESNVGRSAAERESAALGAKAPRVPQPEPGPARVTPGQADKPSGDSGLRAVHKGRAVYAVIDHDNKDAEVLTGLSKEEAEDFNNLSADKKAAFVAKGK